MAQHFLTPVAILVRIAYTRRLDMELDRGANHYTAHAAAKGQVSDALSALDVDSTEIATIMRAVYEMNRAERAGRNLSANRAMSIAIYRVYQPGWSRAQVLLAARRAGRVLP